MAAGGQGPSNELPRLIRTTACLRGGVREAGPTPPGDQGTAKGAKDRPPEDTDGTVGWTKPRYGKPEAGPEARADGAAENGQPDGYRTHECPSEEGPDYQSEGPSDGSRNTDSCRALRELSGSKESEGGYNTDRGERTREGSCEGKPDRDDHDARVADEAPGVIPVLGYG